MDTIRWVSRSWRWVAALAVAVAVAACGGGGAERPRDIQPPQSYQDALNAWQASGIASYDLTYRKGCFCVDEGPITVSVLNGQVVGAVRNGQPLTGAELQSVRSMADLYQMVGDAYRQGASRVDFAADPRTGQISSIYIDYSAQIADEEVSFTIVGFSLPK